MIRMPSRFNEKEATEKAKMWCTSLVEKKSTALSAFEIRTYQSGQEIQIWGEIFTIQMKYQPNGPNQITWDKSQNIQITLNDNHSQVTKNQIIKELLSKFAAKRFLIPVSLRVHELNKKYFQSNIGNIRLKNNHSNWGSCSTKGNINLATRLLLAPREVIDYVIIHELAHTKEMNHSKRFWAWVEKACPEYKHHEKWLKVNSNLCSF